MAPYNYLPGKTYSFIISHKSVKQIGIAQLGLLNLMFMDLPSSDFTKFIIYLEVYRSEKHVGNK